ncbi:RAMP superfamily CRISPR-associated protein [Desulfatirhabdium butyrativorans]|uniref:RAMP superfamily CRISPR-associated protein n=1 Tax=Desulfatirhabdium butyrativorans TaxID=340467 RepID=UPI0004265744|nr:RAMP superfamily CRISPR-associated protein [Desulfatirhabdium butyrativorans]
MSFDLYASLAEIQACPTQVNEGSLASGFVNGCAIWSCRDEEKNNARQCYMKRAAELELNVPADLQFDPDHAFLPDPAWFGIDVFFTLASPWYSKDDRPFHVLDNPVRKDRVFGVPFMSAASWKGLLRWACRMQAGLREHLEKHDMKMDGWNDPSWIIHLFGNEKGEDERSRAGALVFYPTWFNKVGFEVINPHSRTRRAGTQPIYYEVVPAKKIGRLRLLYAPLPGGIENDKVTPADFIDGFIDSIRTLLETYGISAKRTAGWGTANINNEKSELLYLESSRLSELFSQNIEVSSFEQPSDELRKLMTEQGDPISVLLDAEGKLISKTQFKKLADKKPCTNKELETFKKWYEHNSSEYKGSLGSDGSSQSAFKVRKVNLRKFLDARKGGDQ